MTTSDTENDYLEEYDVDYDDDDSAVYNPDEHSLTRYNIILCELYNELLHGETNNQNVKSSYLVYCRFKQLDTDYIDDYTYDFNSHYSNLINDNHPAIKHSVYRNYKHIISRQNYIKPEIAECVYLENQECVAILKTFWIKIIQRVWKNVIKNRKEIIRKVCNVTYLKQRETTMNSSRLYYPELRGMLSPLKDKSNCVY